VALVHGRERTCALLGAFTIAFSSILVRLSHASPSAAAIFRCAYALPVLGLLAWMEDRRLGSRSWRERRAGLAFGRDPTRGTLFGRLVPSWPGAGWLITLALTSQVVGWLLISSSLPRLPAALTSVLLTVQPVGSVALAALILRHRASCNCSEWGWC
jgi:drug/metabolite transporter (DMT)-like permease